MSLPWFPFHIKDYLADTMHLSTEANGAYLWLILRYYDVGGPLPDDDRKLAGITRLSLDRWMEHRHFLEEFFTVTDSVWRHERCDDEIRDGQRRHERTVNATEAAKSARDAKKTETDAPRTPLRSTSRTPRRLTVIDTDNVASVVTDSVTDNAADTVTTHTLTETSHYNSEREVSRSDSPKAFQEETSIDPGFQPNETAIQRCHDQGATDEEIDSQIRKFISYHQLKGNLSRNWQASWANFWENWKPHKARAAPRIEVNMGRGPLDYKPTTDEFDRAVALFAKSASKWSSQLGPEPGMGGCRCPPEILIRHGIDPATGLKAKVQA